MLARYSIKVINYVHSNPLIVSVQTPEAVEAALVEVDPLLWRIAKNVLE